MRIAVAMSGGVDSSVAAALLKEEGHEVIGLTMQLLPKIESRCCGIEAIYDARRVARQLDIPHYVIDLRGAFDQTVIADFCREYSAGMTPNPCILCNNIIKFGALLDRARELDAEYVGTGHYARIERDETTGRPVLKKGIDRKKDQSYFLCRLTPEQLSLAMFPVGGMTKEAVRKKAAGLGLPTAERPESQEICFIPGDNHAPFIAERVPSAAASGEIYNAAGKKLGEHRGIANYTIGQRHGLGIAGAEPLYVTALLPDRNAIVVGTKEQAYGDDLTAGEINWLGAENHSRPMKLKTKIRYRQEEADAEVTPQSTGEFYVKFTRPQMAITPGQTIAFYEGDRVLGGGKILRQGK